MFGGKKDNKSSGGNQSLVGAGTTIEGNIAFSGDCFVDGTIKGDVSAAGSEKAYLSVSEEGVVKGTVSVPVLDLSGCIEGDVYVSEKAVFGASAKVIGNVHYKQVEIAAGAEINGQLIHDEPKAGVTEIHTSSQESGSYYDGAEVKTAS